MDENKDTNQSQRKDEESGKDSPSQNPSQSNQKAAEASPSSSGGALMFAFDESPHNSPRKTQPASSAQTNSLNNPGQAASDVDSPRNPPHGTGNMESPSNSPRSKRFRSPADFLTRSSPPRFVSFEEIMQAANGVTNMTLAHEIAVDNNFRFQKTEAPVTSLEKQVRDIMHKAFWDVLEEKLRESPPDYSQALVLLQEVKENLMDIMLPHHQRIRAQIDEVLDLELIEQQADHGVLDVMYYAKFVITVMSKMCAPVRDDDIAKLTDVKDIVPLYKAIFSMLDVMKLDMANFTIQQIRPYIQNQSVEYERTKFQQILQQQKDNGLDGLEVTRAWLHRAGDKVYQQMAAKSSTASASIGQKQPVPVASPSAILNTAYMELLQWPENYVFPETMLMDEHRFMDLQEKAQWLALVASVLMVTYNMVGDPIAGLRPFKEKLKDMIAVIIAGIPFSKVKDVMPNVGQQVVKEVKGCMKEHGYPEMSEDRVKMLQGLVEGVASPQQPVHKCLRERLMSCIQHLLSNPGAKEVQVPSGFAAMADEFSHVYGQFLRLISHNRAVFGLFYADIISGYLKKKSEETEQNTREDS